MCVCTYDRQNKWQIYVITNNNSKSIYLFFPFFPFFFVVFSLLCLFACSCCFLFLPRHTMRMAVVCMYICGGLFMKTTTDRQNAFYALLLLNPATAKDKCILDLTHRLRRPEKQVRGPLMYVYSKLISSHPSVVGCLMSVRGFIGTFDYLQHS